MSALAEVLDAARSGESAPAIARRLGLSRDLVAAMLETGQRLGRIELLDVQGCSTGPGACAPGSRVACASCPIKPRAPRA